MMRILPLAAAALLALPISANAGCLTGALVGGAAGHLAGHGILGAGAGCIIAHQHSKHLKQQQAAQQANMANSNKPAPIGNGPANGNTYVQPGNGYAQPGN